MAEVKINQLPTMASSEFTDNDYFLVVDDGSARLLSRPTFQAWMRENVKGEQGIQGVAGKEVAFSGFEIFAEPVLRFSHAATGHF